MFIDLDKLLEVDIFPPSNLKSWLIHKDSLTKKLKNRSGEAQLQVLSQNWTKPNWWDQFTLSVDTPVIHRDILMFSHQIPCWFARTIIPNLTYQSNQDLFERLKNESLGTILFSDQNIKRNFLFYYAINNQNLEYYWIPKILQEEQSLFWLRLSGFVLPESTKLFLVEIILPGLISIVS